MKKRMDVASLRKWTLLLCAAVAVMFSTAAVRIHGGEEGYYPNEPVYLTTDIPIGNIDEDFALSYTITTPDNRVWTNCLTQGNLVGRQVALSGAETNTLFFVNFSSQACTNVFGAVGKYTIRIQTSTSTVSVVSPPNGEKALVSVVQGDMLPRIALLSNANDLDEGIKTKCKQVLRVSENGRYAEYAKAYLAVGEFYETINLVPEAVGQFRPDFSSVHTKLAALRVSRPILKKMVLFHLGYAEGLAKNLNAINTLSRLVRDLPVSPWSERARKMLTELTD